MALGTARSAAIAYRTDSAVPSVVGNIAQSNAVQVESTVALIAKDHLPIGGGRSCRCSSRGGLYWTIGRGYIRILPTVTLLARLALGTLPRVLRGTFAHLHRHADAGWMGSSPTNCATNKSFRFVLLVFILGAHTDRT